MSIQASVDAEASAYIVDGLKEGTDRADPRSLHFTFQRLSKRQDELDRAKGILMLKTRIPDGDTGILDVMAPKEAVPSNQLQI